MLGWPRTTDSLCPTCVREARERILSGQCDVERIVDDHTGEIKAQILERDGRIIIEKTCPQHGTFTDVLSINPDFLAHRTAVSRRDYRAATDRLTITARRRSIRPRLGPHRRPHQPLQHDATLLHGRQPVGYVHERTLPEVKQILDDALSVKPGVS